MQIKTAFGDIEIKSSAEIVDNLERQTCPHCGQENCCYECDMSVADMQDPKSKLRGDPEAEVRDRIFSNGFCDGMTSLLLALYPVIKDTDPSILKQAVETAMDACDNDS